MKCFMFNICWDDLLDYSSVDGLTSITTKPIEQTWNYTTNQSTYSHKPAIKSFILRTHKMVQIEKLFKLSKINVYGTCSRWRILRISNLMYWKSLSDIMWMNILRMTLCLGLSSILWWWKNQLCVMSLMTS